MNFQISILNFFRLITFSILKVLFLTIIIDRHTKAKKYPQYNTTYIYTRVKQKKATSTRVAAVVALHNYGVDSYDVDCYAVAVAIGVITSEL